MRKPKPRGGKTLRMSVREMVGHLQVGDTSIRRAIARAQLLPDSAGKYDVAVIVQKLQEQRERMGQNLKAGSDPETQAFLNARIKKLQGDMIQLRLDELKGATVPYVDYIADIEELCDRLRSGVKRLEQCVAVILGDKAKIHSMRREFDAVLTSIADGEKSAKWRGERKREELIKDDEQDDNNEGEDDEE